jgi:hypothetical protein
MKKWKAEREVFMKDPVQQRAMTIGQPALKNKCSMYFNHLQFLLSVIGDGKETFSNIPSSENDTVSEAGGSATDGTVNYLYMKRSSGRVHRIQSHSGS